MKNLRKKMEKSKEIISNSRTKNSMRNIIFSIIAYGLQVILAFVVRRYFIYHFNEEYLGLNSLFTNVLSILSLAELGFGTAVLFSMYKPMAEGDDEKVRQLLYLYKKFYFIIAIVVGCLGLCVIPFMGYFAKKAPNVDVNLYIIYIIYLANSVVSYFCAHRRALFYASQRNDFESKINIISNIVLYVAQLLVIILLKNYYIYLSLMLISTLINCLLVVILTNKEYKNYLLKPNNPLDKSEKKLIEKNVFALIFHKIGSVVVYSTDSLVIYLMLDAATLGRYSNYLMITSAVTTLISLVASALRGSIGNSIATQTSGQNHKLMSKMNFIYMWMVSFCAICIFCLANPFIDIILTKGSETTLTFDFTILILICYYFFFLQAKGMVGMFKECVGLFYQDRFKSIIEATINLIVSIVLAKFIGLAGVIIGTIVSTISTCIWVEPYVLNKNYYHKSTWAYLLQLAFRTIITTIAGGITYLVCSFIPNTGIIMLLVKAVVCVVLSNILLLVAYFWTPEFKDSINWGKEIFKNFKSKKKAKAVADVVAVPVDIDKDGVVDSETIAVFDKETKEQIEIADKPNSQEENDDKNIADDELKLKENEND